MMGGAGSLTQCLAAFRRDSSGNATFEFVLVFPVLMFMFFSIGEIGVMITRTLMLSRGIDLAVRDVRLGLVPGITHDQLKARICEHAFLLGECEDVVLLELRPMPGFGASYPTGGVTCVDRTEEVQPVTTFNPGNPTEIVLVRACLIVDPIFPGTGLGAMLPRDASGGYSIIVQSAFMNEPA